MIIHKVGVRSLATVFAYIYAVIGLIVGAILSIVALAGPDQTEITNALATLGGPFAVFVLPLVAAIKGYLTGAISGWVFNYAARVSGGVEVEVESA